MWGGGGVRSVTKDVDSVYVRQKHESKYLSVNNIPLQKDNMFSFSQPFDLQKYLNDALTLFVMYLKIEILT
jgi:hypothetical protein